jgi:hypothetical protein
MKELFLCRTAPTCSTAKMPSGFLSGAVPDGETRNSFYFLPFGTKHPG